MATLIRIDRNGSKYFEETCACDKCHGTGTFEWAFVNGFPTRSGQCFKCGGYGTLTHKWVERTAEYQAKLDAKREARNAKAHPVSAEDAAAEAVAEAERIAKWRAGNWMYEGFAEDGTGYLLTGNTYRAKDAIRAQGGKWNAMLKGYISPVCVHIAGIRVREITAQELCGSNGQLDYDKVLDLAEAING